MQLTVGELAAIMGGVFALTTSIIGILVKLLFSSYREKSIKELESIKQTNDLEIKAIREALESVKKENLIEIKAIRDARETCSKNHDQHRNQINNAVEKLNDSWFNFIREDAAMEATRGRKVDALFEVVDSMKERVRQIPEIVNRKIDEIYKLMKHDLEDDLREYISSVLKKT